MLDALELVVRTPHTEVLRSSVCSLRLPTETGSVGIFPRAERTVIAIEPGLVVARRPVGRLLVATAGGLLRVEAHSATLLSAIAVVGKDPDGVRAVLTDLMTEPSAETELRRRIDALERGLMTQSLRRDARGRGRPGRSDDAR
jgi:F0F1-type ATP synthase epsilon subunit